MTLEFNEQDGIDHGKDKTERLLYARFQDSSETPSVLSFLVKIHLAKNERGARIFILVVILLAFFISVYFFVNAFSGPTFID